MQTLKQKGEDTMSHEKVGIVTGQVWQLLQDKKEVNLASVPRMLKEKSPVVYQALGWLAREDKLVYRSEGEKTFRLAFYPQNWLPRLIKVFRSAL